MGSGPKIQERGDLGACFGADPVTNRTEGWERAKRRHAVRFSASPGNLKQKEAHPHQWTSFASILAYLEYQHDIDTQDSPKIEWTIANPSFLLLLDVRFSRIQLYEMMQR